MFRIDNPTAASSLPAPVAPGTPGWWTNGNPGTGAPPTVIDADWMNRVQEELISILTAAGVTPSKTTYNQVLVSIQSLISSVTRISLNVATNYYVNASTGSDSNPGTIGQPWQTISHAVLWLIANIDTRGNNVAINVANGTYTQSVNITSPLIGGGQLSILGNNASPSSCIISVANADCFAVTNAANVFLDGFKLSTTGSGNAINTAFGATVTLGNINFGAVAANHLFASASASIIFTQNYSITGGGVSHMFSQENGLIGTSAAVTCTLTGTPAFSNAFCLAENLSGNFLAGTVTYSGGATGKRYDVEQNSVIATNGRGANYFPGNIAGTNSSGGQYT